ncbi:hypothetical protein TRICI_000037 [Trichomonascus ciferrii]|uniref:Uncharacterized protein n=1 Tax=Trichomonascus ciferrii TaxID=44093 RepID=A0A642VEM0_9ASCO|nr:hypothetical protein TRICI_000037 [Trichomonascus ciferrii]
MIFNGMDLISLPEEIICIVIRFFLNSLGDITVIRRVCRVLKDVCDRELPLLDTELEVEFGSWEMALALGNKGRKKILCPEVVEHKEAMERCGFDYVNLTNVNEYYIQMDRKLVPEDFSAMDNNGLGFWILHVRKLNIHKLTTQEPTYELTTQEPTYELTISEPSSSCLITFFDYLEEKKRTFPLHVTFCEHGDKLNDERVVDSPGVRRVVEKINNSSLNFSVDFQITLSNEYEEKLHLGPKISECSLYYSVSETKQLCDVVELRPHHVVSLAIVPHSYYRTTQRLQRIITQCPGMNLRSLELQSVMINAEGILDDLNVDELIIHNVEWHNRPSNKPNCSAKIVRTFTCFDSTEEFEIFNFTRLQRLYWIYLGKDDPTIPQHLKRRIPELDLLSVDWPHDRPYEEFSYLLLKPLIQNSKIRHLVVTTNIDVESVIPTGMNKLETISIIYDVEERRQTPLEFLNDQAKKLLPRTPALKLMECYDASLYSQPKCPPNRTALVPDILNTKRRQLGLL